MDAGQRAAAQGVRAALGSDYAQQLRAQAAPHLGDKVSAEPWNFAQFCNSSSREASKRNSYDHHASNKAYVPATSSRFCECCFMSTQSTLRASTSMRCNDLQSLEHPANTPPQVARRKHQIGTLLANAKLKELEILEGKASGMKSKAETQGKYGWK